MKILIWAEGGKNIGSGHLNRSIDIYIALKTYFDFKFFAIEKESYNFFKRYGLEIINLSELKEKDFILITDLRYPERYREILSELAYKSYKHISINDMGLAQREADIIIDGHIGRIKEYKINKNTEYYLGPDYFLLKTKYRHFNKVKKKIKKRAKKLFLTLGGWSRVEDLRYLTELLLSLNFSLTVSWGFGKSNRERRIFRKSFPSVKIVTDKRFIPRKYYESDITIAAGGISYYEALSGGTPLIMFYKDDFQKFTVKTLVDKGLGISAGNLFDFNKNDFIVLIKDYKYNYELREKHSKNGKKIVDGLGIYRLKKIICSAALRFAVVSDSVRCRLENQVVKS